jgi:hypothetical protein
VFFSVHREEKVQASLSEQVIAPSQRAVPHRAWSTLTAKNLLATVGLAPPEQ